MSRDRRPELSFCCCCSLLVGWLVDVTLKISTYICAYLVGSYEVMQTHSLSSELRFLLLLFFVS